MVDQTPTMPDNLGKLSTSSNSGVTCCSNASGTPATRLLPSTNRTDIINKLVTTTGPVKTVSDTKAYLEQRSLIVIDDNYDLEMLAQLLVTASLDFKIPDQTMSIMRVMGLLMVSKFQSNLANEIAVVVTDKLHDTSDHLGRQLKQEHEFIMATSTAQAKHVQQLHKLTSRVKDSVLLMETNTTIKIRQSVASTQLPTRLLRSLNPSSKLALHSNKVTHPPTP